MKRRPLPTGRTEPQLAALDPEPIRRADAFAASGFAAHEVDKEALNMIRAALRHPAK